MTKLRLMYFYGTQQLYIPNLVQFILFNWGIELMFILDYFFQNY
jgi:hypothetical protein